MRREQFGLVKCETAGEQALKQVSPDIPSVSFSVQIVERAKMISHRAKSTRNQEFPPGQARRRHGVHGSSRHLLCRSQAASEQ